MTWTPDPEKPRCACCGTRLPPPSATGGQPRRFCSGACRSAGYRRRQRQLPESMLRLPHAQGAVPLSDYYSWLDRQEAHGRERRARRDLRARRVARNRAWRWWRHARAVASRTGALYSGCPSKAAAAAWRDIAAAAAECARLKVRGVRWNSELERAQRKIAELTPPHPTRAEWRRQLLEQEMLGKGDVGRSGISRTVNQLPPAPSWARDGGDQARHRIM